MIPAPLPSPLSVLRFPFNSPFPPKVVADKGRSFALRMAADYPSFFFLA